MLRMLSLCSGIGGADLAAEWTNAIEVVGQVEKDLYCQAVLAKHWPHVKLLSDIKEVKGDEFGHIDVIVAGFPCQPHSLAGQRKGGQDERDLWPEVRRIIGSTQPRWVVAENVPGLLTTDAGRFFSGIVVDLDALGYRVGWTVYGASEIGAPHQRERVFIVAYHPGLGCGTWRTEPEQGRQANAESVGLPEVADSHSDRFGVRQVQHERQPASVGQANACHDGTQGSLAHTESAECQWSGDTRQWWPGSTDGSAALANASSSGWQELDVATITGEPGHVTWRQDCARYKRACGGLHKPTRTDRSSHQRNERGTTCHCPIRWELH